MGISLCIIVKNEEDWIKGSVGSVRSIISEVIIADTGSADSTRRRVKPLADKSLKLPWNDSLAEPRNATMRGLSGTCKRQLSPANEGRAICNWNNVCFRKAM
jgi:glycosyltransferase involved in cell wall biosynthesis